MKVNLLRNGNSTKVLNGYINIDPYSKPDSGKVFGDVMNLDEFVDDGEAEQIIAEDVIDFVDSTVMPAVLNNWIKKLAHGGQIIIGGVDLEEVAYAIVQGRIALDRTNALLHGNSQYNWDTKKTTLSLDILKEILTKQGLRILKARIDDYRMVVVAERP